MKHKIDCAWVGGMGFEADLMGHKILMDAQESDGGKDSGARPKPLLLAALAGCSGMDVVSILRKMREPLTWFNMEVEGEVREEHPKLYTSMELVYQFKKSDGLNAENVEKAVELSQEKYCGVSALFKLALPLKFRIEYR